MAHAASAGVVHTDLSEAPLVLTGGESSYSQFPLDIDNDGLNDVSFTIYHYGAAGTEHIQVQQESSEKIFTSDPVYVGDRVYPVASFLDGMTISDASPVAKGHSEKEIRLTRASGKTTFSKSGSYLGLKTSGGFNAWVLLETDTSDPKRQILSIRGYAYQDDSEKPIPAASIPQPSTTAMALGLLAAGALGRKRIQRRVQSN
jgi:MYXO-CTERM domain-containing protein